MLRALQVLLRIALYVLLAAVALVGSLLLHLQVPIARHIASEWLSDFVSQEIRGSLAISRIDRLSPTEIVARGVVLFDGEGRKIADADLLMLRPDWNAIAEFRVAFRSARLENASVHLIDLGSGLPSLFTTFDSPHPSPKPKTSSPLHVTIDGVELWRVTLYGDLLGLDGFRADDLHALGRLDIGHDVQARVDHAHATMNQPFGYPGIVDSLSGMISTVGTEGVNLRARAHRGAETATASVRYAVPKGKPNAGPRLTIRVRGSGLTAYTLHGLGYDWVPDILIPLSGKVTLDGPPGELKVDAALETEAGNADASGFISSARGVSVTLRTQGLELARVFKNYPHVTAAGTLRIDSAPGDKAPPPTLHAEIEPLLYGMLAIPGINADGAVLDSGLRVDRLEARSKSARINGHGRIFTNGGLAFDVQATFPEIGDDPNLRKLVPNAKGKLDATLHIDTPQVGAAKLNFAGKIALRNLRYDVVRADLLELHGSARGDPEHPRVALKVTGKQVAVSDYVLGDPSLSLQGGPRDYVADGQFASAGKRTFNVHAQVHAERGVFNVDAEPIEFSFGANSWRGALQGVRIEAGKGVELGLLRLASRSQRLEARGALRFNGDDQLDVQLQDFDLGALRALLGGRLALTHGRADAHLELSGDISDPEIRLQGALRDGIVFGVPDVGLLYLIGYKSGRIEAGGDIDLGARGLLRVDGSADIDGLSDPLHALEYADYNVALNAQALDLQLLPKAKAAKILGTLSSKLRFEGTLQEPEFNGSVQLDELTFPGGDPLAVAAEGGYGGGALHTQFSVSDERGALATAGATMQLDWNALRGQPELFMQTLLRGPWQLRGETIARRLDRMPRPIVQSYPASVATRFDLHNTQGSTEGTVDFNAGWEEPFDVNGCAADTRAQIDGKLTLEHGTSNVRFGISAGKKPIGAVELEFDTPLDRWIDQGHVDEPRMLSGNGHVEVDAMQQVPYLCGYGNGGVRAEFELENALTDNPLFSFSVDAKFAPPLMRQAGRTQLKTRGCEDDPIRMRVYAKADRQELSGSAQLWGCHGGNGDLEGRMGVRWDELYVLPSPRADGVVQALVRFDRAHLEPLLDRIPGVINASAIARGQFNISGTVEKARTSGQIEISQGHIYLVSTGQELTDITTGISFQGDWAKIDYFQARAGKGQLEASGGIDFAGIRPRRARMALRASKLPLKREGVETAQITGSGVIDADIEPQGTRAVLELHDLAVRLPDTSSRALQPLDANPDVVVVTEAELVRAKSYPVDVMIRGDKRITVRRTDFQAGVSLELAVHYAEPELNIGGYIAFSSGDFEVFGKRFQINSGALRFDGESDFNPDVYLSATEKPEASGLSPVSVSVTGTLNEPIVTFSSDVCPGEMGAITYLVSGRCAADDPDLAQESSDAQGAFASGIVGGVLSLGVQNQLKGIAPRIAVGTNEVGRQRVSAGFSTESLIPKFMRKLVHRVYVEGGVSGPGSEQGANVAKENTGQTTALEFLIELYFPHNIVGSGRFAPAAWGVDAVWEP